MPKGGARARSGPAPDPNALRRNRRDDQAGWKLLPRERPGEPPAWPLTPASERELEVWATMWRKPVAFLWEREQLTEQVAMYVRQFVEGEQPNSSAENRKTVRLLGEDLYLSLSSRMRARIRVEGEDPSVLPTLASVTPLPTSSARDRLRTAEPDGGR